MRRDVQEILQRAASRLQRACVGPTRDADPAHILAASPQLGAARYLLPRCIDSSIFSQIKLLLLSAPFIVPVNVSPIIHRSHKANIMAPTQVLIQPPSVIGQASTKITVRTARVKNDFWFSFGLLTALIAYHISKLEWRCTSTAGLGSTNPIGKRTCSNFAVWRLSLWPQCDWCSRRLIFGLQCSRHSCW